MKCNKDGEKMAKILIRYLNRILIIKQSIEKEFTMTWIKIPTLQQELCNNSKWHKAIKCHDKALHLRYL